MIKYFPILLLPFILSGCFFNQTGISAKYYANDCNEYYDVQGFYHKECKDENFITYKEVGNKNKEAADFAIGIQEE
jgi:hypothetical protein